MIFFKKEKIPFVPYIVTDSDNAPLYKTNGAAMADLKSAENYVCLPECVTRIDLGIKFEIPTGYFLRLYPRSSMLAKIGLICPVGIIDSDYRENVKLIAYNPSRTKTVTILRGDRVAQIEIVKQLSVPNWFRSVDERNGGFGSTGR